MNLRDYLHFERYTEKKMTIKKFSESLDLTSTHIAGYLRGRTRLSKKVAKAIEKITNGKVTAAEIMQGNPIKKRYTKNSDLK